MPETGRELGDTDSSAEDSRARWLRRRATVFLAVVAATSVHMVASGGPLTVVASSSADYLVVSLPLVSIVEAVKEHGDPVSYRCSSRFGTSRGFPVLSRWCRGQVRDAPVPSGGRTLGLLNRGGL